MSITDSKESLLVAAAGLDHDEDRRARLALERQNHQARVGCESETAAEAM
jgi:hypothetical protein